VNITESQADQLIRKSGGVMLTVEFFKRTVPHKFRRMLCRVNTDKGKTGVGRSFSDKSAHVVTVFDMHKDGYRCIPLEGIIRIRFRGKDYIVEH
jgi:hypothetical protein